MIDLKIHYLSHYDMEQWGELKFANPNDACFDLYCAMPKQSVELQTGDRMIVPTGVRVEIPLGYELQIRARSGLASKNGIIMGNGIGTIDVGYKNELFVIFEKSSGAMVDMDGNRTVDMPFVLERGMRIAQACLKPITPTNLETVEDLTDDHNRGGGLGSSGVK